MSEETITIDVRGCARCEGDGHTQLEFRKLAHPVVQHGAVTMTHWATCPTNGEPILMATVAVEE